MFRKRMTSGLATLAVLAVSATACSGSGSNSGAGGGGQGDTLTVVAPGAPASLDPAKANVGSDNWFVNLTYDTVLRQGENGRTGAGLATKWGYVGTGNTAFEFTLRSGLQFADGTPLDAKAVAASLNYSRKNGLNVSWTSAIDSVTATGPLTVRIHCSSPHPNLPQLMTQILMVGSVISPQGLASPTKMGTQSFGAGPYVLDTAHTVSGDHYTYTPNPHYWDKKKIHWKKVVIKVVGNPNSGLQAVKAGQADAMAITANQVDTADSGGLQVVGAPNVFLGVNLVDRNGTLAKPLKDLRVRQALNYAVDRDAITKAIVQGHGHSTDQISLPGLDGFAADYDNHYPYDPAKAKQLLTEAGYPNGFSLTMETQGFFGIDLVTQAVVQQWKQIGVTADVTTDTSVGQWLASATSQKYPLLGFGYGGATSYALSLDWMLPHATAFNPFASSDPKITGKLAAAAAAAPAEQPVLYQDVMRYVVDQAWFVSVLRMDGLYAFNSKKLTGLTAAPSYIPDLAWNVAPK
ncbi:ABC transporter substrate-binding protein [Streptomyces sp. H10-C2]|uniref:ABC transporter substrate-binding protein n=1 Tax=unclassified Streptomyces TaxID=2593676 RepID=UPI0024BA1332|nr:MULTISPECIES: ABC transporter substrate-binding protein [unclassified Streptomyces]MDJ0345862.1 ABC transporter substrate-binding protein [Streptomyces sp. PH10-H1]MDJ0371172.1 ABC transporter substrate-binding protein [Streptomyces sp. H10-C2]